MWPDVERYKQGDKYIGYKFSERFWREWGPTNMYYYHPEIFNDNKHIGLIQCIYQSRGQVKFKEDEVAMALAYKCGEFGEHVALFCYTDTPDIQYTDDVWCRSFFDDIETEDDRIYLARNCASKMKHEKLSEQQANILYLENLILKGKNSPEVLQKATRNICGYLVSKYGKDETTAYELCLEKIASKLGQIGYPATTAYNQRIQEELSKLNDTQGEPISTRDFEKLIYELLSEENQKGSRYKSFSDILKFIEKMGICNDLDSMFRNSREIFRNKVEQVSKDEEGEEVVHGRLTEDLKFVPDEETTEESHPQKHSEFDEFNFYL